MLLHPMLLRRGYPSVSSLPSGADPRGPFRGDDGPLPALPSRPSLPYRAGLCKRRTKNRQPHDARARARVGNSFDRVGGGNSSRHDDDNGDDIVGFLSMLLSRGCRHPFPRALRGSARARKRQEQADKLARTAELHSGRLSGRKLDRLGRARKNRADVIALPCSCLAAREWVVIRCYPPASHGELVSPVSPPPSPAWHVFGTWSDFVVSHPPRDARDIKVRTASTGKISRCNPGKADRRPTETLFSRKRN